MLQAQRDYFGAHTYERVDKPRGEFFHQLDGRRGRREFAHLQHLRTDRRYGTTSGSRDRHWHIERSLGVVQRARRARCRTLAQRRYPLTTDHDGRAELSPNGVLRALLACLDETHTAVESTRGNWSIAAVGTSCFWHSLVGLNEHGNPLTPFITWADGRPGQSARALRESADETAYHQLTGCMLHASFWPARLRWLRKDSRISSGRFLSGCLPASGLSAI